MVPLQYSNDIPVAFPAHGEGPWCRNTGKRWNNNLLRRHVTRKMMGSTTPPERCSRQRQSDDAVNFGENILTNPTVVKLL